MREFARELVVEPAQAWRPLSLQEPPDKATVQAEAHEGEQHYDGTEA